MPGTYLVDQNGNPITSANRLPVDAQLTGSNVPDAQKLPVKILSSGGLEPAIGSGAGDSDGAANLLYVSARGESFNESTWDRVRGNTQGTLLASAARTATAGSPNQTNYNAKGIMIFLNVTAAPVTPGSGGLTLFIYGVDPISGASFVLNVAPAAVTIATRKGFIIYPGATAATGDIVQTTNMILPRLWNILVSHGDAQSYTYSVGYSLIL